MYVCILKADVEGFVEAGHKSGLLDYPEWLETIERFVGDWKASGATDFEMWFWDEGIKLPLTRDLPHHTRKAKWSRERESFMFCRSSIVSGHLLEMRLRTRVAVAREASSQLRRGIELAHDGWWRSSGDDIGVSVDGEAGASDPWAEDENLPVGFDSRTSLEHGMTILKALRENSFVTDKEVREYLIGLPPPSNVPRKAVTTVKDAVSFYDEKRKLKEKEGTVGQKQGVALLRTLLEDAIGHMVPDEASGVADSEA